MNIDGKLFIDAIATRLVEDNIRCYDSAIINKIRLLTAGELSQIATFGDVTKWRNERVFNSAQETKGEK